MSPVTPINVNDEPIFDQWTGLDYKFATTRHNGRTFRIAADWMGWHRRRVTAYSVLRALLSNSARRLMEVTGTTPDEVRDAEYKRQQHREYGDPETMRDAIRDALLGENMVIVVDGADDYDPDFDPDAEPVDGENKVKPEELEKRRAEQLEARQAFELQEWLRTWATRERMPAKVVETETDAVGLGDGVYSFGWSTAKDRVKFRCWDPAFYFPVLTDEDDFPSKVHVAWEFEDEIDSTKKFIRRITWQLGPILPELDLERNPVVDENGPVLQQGDRLDDQGRITRRYPYAPDEDSRLTCYMTDATFELDTGRPAKIDDLDEDKARFELDDDGEVRRRDLRFDFIPVVHVPNTIAEKDHFGKSSLTIIAQVLEDLAGADSELAAASKTVAVPPIGISGVGTAGTDEMTYESGAVWDLGQNGKLTSIDLSGALDALLKYVESLLKRASVNGRVPEEWLGRIKEGEPPSGISRRMGFGPLDRMVGHMRMVRDEKYPLVLLFVWRISVVNGAKNVPKTFLPSTIEFGTYMPTDLTAVVDAVTRARQTEPPTISLESAIAMLIEAGMPIDDVSAEVKRIESRDFKGANELLDATGEEGLAFDHLGRPRPSGSVPPEGPPIVLPEDQL